MLLSCSNILTLHDIEIEKPLFLSNNHRDTITQTIFSSNSRVVASCGKDSLINFYNPNLELVSSIEDPDLNKQSVVSIAFSSNNHFLAYSSDNGIFKIWEFANEKSKYAFDLNQNYVSSISYAKGDQYLACGTNGGDILIFDSYYSATKMKFSSNYRVNNLKCSPFNENMIVSGYSTGELLVYDVLENKPLHKFNHHNENCSGISFSPINSSLLCSVGEDKNINFYDIFEKTHVKNIETQYPLTSISFNLDGKTIAVSNINGEILIYDLRNTHKPKNVLLGHQKKINYLEFSKKESSQFMTNLTSKAKITEKEKKVPEVRNTNVTNTEKKVPVNEPLKETSKYNYSNRINEKPLNEISNYSNYQKSQVNDEIKNKNVNTDAFKSNFNDAKSKIQGVVNNFNNSLLNKNSQIVQNNDTMTVDQENKLNNSITSKLNNLDNLTQNFIKSTIENEFFKMKQFIHEEIQLLHIDIIRQFEIQQSNLIEQMKNLSLVNTRTSLELDRLTKENNMFKSQYF